MMKRLLSAALGLAIFVGAAQAQIPGNFAAGTVYGNSSASARPPRVETLTAILDRALGSTVNSVIARGASTWAAVPFVNPLLGQVQLQSTLSVGLANPIKWLEDTTVTGVMGCAGNGYVMRTNYSGDGSFALSVIEEVGRWATSRTATSCIFFNPSNLAIYSDTDWYKTADNPTFVSRNQLVFNALAQSSCTPTVVAQSVTAIACSTPLTGYTAAQTVGYTIYLNNSITAQGTVPATAGGVVNTAQFLSATGLPSAAIFTSTPTILVQPPNISGGTARLDVSNLKLTRQPPDVYPATDSMLFNIMMESYQGTAGVKGPFTEYVGLMGIVGSPTTGAASGIWDFRRQVAGVMKHLYLGGGFYLPNGSPVTIDKGDGTINLNGIYKDGNALPNSVPAPLSLNTSTGVVTWTGLTANAIITAGAGGTVPVTPGATLDTGGSIVATSSASNTPQHIFTNTTADNNGHTYLVQKDRAGGAVTGAENIFNFLGQARSGGYQNAVQMLFSVAAAPSGSNIPTKMVFKVSNGSGLLNQSLAFDNNGHIGLTASLTPSVGACGTTPGATAGSDVSGTVVPGTTTTTCVINFAATYTAAPLCTASHSSGTGVGQSAKTTTTTTFTFGVAVTGGTLTWNCLGV